MANRCLLITLGPWTVAWASLFIHPALDTKHTELRGIDTESILQWSLYMNMNIQINKQITMLPPT